jgi:hypothetical protein
MRRTFDDVIIAAVCMVFRRSLPEPSPFHWVHPLSQNRVRRRPVVDVRSLVDAIQRGRYQVEQVQIFKEWPPREHSDISAQTSPASWTCGEFPHVSRTTAGYPSALHLASSARVLLHRIVPGDETRPISWNETDRADPLAWPARLPGLGAFPDRAGGSLPNNAHLLIRSPGWTH